MAYGLYMSSKRHQRISDFQVEVNQSKSLFGLIKAISYYLSIILDLSYYNLSNICYS